MPLHLTRQGALALTTNLDRIASLFQEQSDLLGVPSEYALKFAYYCDAMADQVEQHAIKMAAEEESEEESEESVGKTAEEDSEESEDESETASKKASSKKAQEDETGNSVDHGASGFDANVIGDTVSGPLEIITPPVEAWMNQYFKQNWFQELRSKQEGGNIGFSVSASTARLRRMAAVSSLSGLADVLTVLHAKVAASEVAAVKAVAADLKKQLDAVAKLRDLSLAQQAVGALDPEVALAADKVAQAITEQLPFLKQAVQNVDSASPVAMLEMQKVLGGGSLKELVALGASIVVEAVKACEGSDKEASVKVAEEVEEESETASKKAEDESEKAEDESEDEESKQASELAQKYGFNLFAR